MSNPAHVTDEIEDEDDEVFVVKESVGPHRPLLLPADPEGPPMAKVKQEKRPASPARDSPSRLSRKKSRSGDSSTKDRDNSNRSQASQASSTSGRASSSSSTREAPLFPPEKDQLRAAAAKEKAAKDKVQQAKNDAAAKRAVVAAKQAKEAAARAEEKKRLDAQAARKPTREQQALKAKASAIGKIQVMQRPEEEAKATAKKNAEKAPIRLPKVLTESQDQTEARKAEEEARRKKFDEDIAKAARVQQAFAQKVLQPNLLDVPGPNNKVALRRIHIDKPTEEEQDCRYKFCFIKFGPPNKSYPYSYFKFHLATHLCSHARFTQPPDPSDHQVRTESFTSIENQAPDKLAQDVANQQHIR